MRPAGAAFAAGGVTLTDDQRLAWLRLIRSENVGPATFRSLINHFGSAQAALDALPDLSRRGGSNRAIAVASRAEAEAEMAAAARIDARFVGLGEPLYPPWLRQADSPPPLVAVRGAGKHLTSPAIAIVGARNASVAGRKMAAILARDLGDADFVVVSGLARGIDAAAHEAALTAGTIAVFDASRLICTAIYSAAAALVARSSSCGSDSDICNGSEVSS
jgi:DNA processing protein